ncbi:MAG TPA: hypothetical protein VL122_05170 [Nitrospirota bacterium]|nr:hypothetical protein [Nitrospirota bacterium]
MVQKRADLQITTVELGGQFHKDNVDMNVVEARGKKVERFKTSMMLNKIKAPGGPKTNRRWNREGSWMNLCQIIKGMTKSRSIAKNNIP